MDDQYIDKLKASPRQLHPSRCLTRLLCIRYSIAKIAKRWEQIEVDWERLSGK